MRAKLVRAIYKAVEEGWGFLNTNLGSAVAGATVGGLITNVYAKAHRAEEVKVLTDNNNKLSKDLEEKTSVETVYKTLNTKLLNDISLMTRDLNVAENKRIQCEASAEKESNCKAKLAAYKQAYHDTYFCWSKPTPRKFNANKLDVEPHEPAKKP